MAVVAAAVEAEVKGEARITKRRQPSIKDKNPHWEAMYLTMAREDVQTR